MAAEIRPDNSAFVPLRETSRGNPAPVLLGYAVGCVAAAVGNQGKGARKFPCAATQDHLGLQPHIRINYGKGLTTYRGTDMSTFPRRSTRSALFSSCAFIGIGLASLIAAGPAQADTTADGASSGHVETVVVTAERRASDIQTTALAITAVSADDLSKSNIVQLADINGIVPGLSIARSSGFETVVTIRGVGLETPENSLTTSPGVALFVDGAYVANSITLDQTLFDIDHIEVLRGPQGALYGQSATGGAILLVTKQANLDSFSGQVTGSYGTYNLNRENFDVNVPLTDTLAMHIAAEHFGHDGFTKVPLIPGFKADDAEDVVGKVDFLWQPLSNLSFRLSTESYHADQNEAAQKNINDPNPDPWVITQDYPAKFDMKTNLTHLTAEWDGSWFTVKSVTAYQWLKNVQGENSSRSAISLINAYDDVVAWNTSLVNYNEELDIQSNNDSPFQWDVGAFLLSQKSSQFVAEYECFAAPACAGYYPPTAANLTVMPVLQDSPNLAYGNITKVDRKSWSVFAQGTYNFTDAFSVTLGGRLNGDTFTDNGINYGGAIFGGPYMAPYTHSSSDHVATYRAELDYKPDPDHMLYVSTNRGYKPGGVNGNNSQSYDPATCANPFDRSSCSPLNYLVVQNQFKPEVNTSYEIGSKNAWLDNHLTVNAAGFYYVYNNYQFIATDPVPFNGGITNIPSTHIWGAEVEAHYLGMDDKFHFNADLSLQDGSIGKNFKTIDSITANTVEATDPNCAFGGQYYNPYCWLAVTASARNVGGNPPAKLPKVLGSFDVSYDFSVFGGILTPRFQLVYRGGYWARVFDEPTVDKVPGYTLVNLNINYIPDDSPFEISILASNVGNVAGVNSRYTDPYGTGQTSQQFTPPRQVIGTVSYHF